MNTTPSSQITTDIIMQSSIKSLERLVVSKHEAFVSSLSIYEKMLKELERILFLHENFMSTKKDALDSSLKHYELVADGLKARLETFERQMSMREAELTHEIGLQRDEFHRMNKAVFDHLKVDLGKLELEMLDRQNQLDDKITLEKEALKTFVEGYKASFDSFEKRSNTTQEDFYRVLTSQHETLKKFEGVLAEGRKLIFWMLGANAVFVVITIIRWCLK